MFSLPPSQPITFPIFGANKVLYNSISTQSYVVFLCTNKCTILWLTGPTHCPFSLPGPQTNIYLTHSFLVVARNVSVQVSRPYLGITLQVILVPDIYYVKNSMFIIVIYPEPPFSAVPSYCYHC